MNVHFALLVGHNTTHVDGLDKTLCTIYAIFSHYIWDVHCEKDVISFIYASWQVPQASIDMFFIQFLCSF